MKKLDWYFNFIGVKSEGWKRIVLLLIILFLLIMVGVWIELEVAIDSCGRHYSLSDNRYRIHRHRNDRNIAVLILFGSIIGFSVIMRIIRWIKEGFRKE